MDEPCNAPCTSTVYSLRVIRWATVLTPVLNSSGGGKRPQTAMAAFGSQAFGYCGRSSWHGRGSKYPSPSFDIRSSSAQCSMINVELPDCTPNLWLQDKRMAQGQPRAYERLSHQSLNRVTPKSGTPTVDADAHELRKMRRAADRVGPAVALEERTATGAGQCLIGVHPREQVGIQELER
ncbi:hypothetical protein BDD14_6020 [Edaphobacter modestus]|uniref:Uncharacterized protein n=1 Tax=Edaphobacter modestus TaxID=388466 RepID=A0A4Q7YFZ2_9BACT|nr:hypothetical protein BDD14_6020 [Edaphobacter modestus]